MAGILELWLHSSESRCEANTHKQVSIDVLLTRALGNCRNSESDSGIPVPVQSNHMSRPRLGTTLERSGMVDIKKLGVRAVGFVVIEQEGEVGDVAEIVGLSVLLKLPASRRTPHPSNLVWYI